MADGVATPSLAFLAGGGEMGGLIGAHDWSATPLGPIEGWPEALRTLVGLMVRTRQPAYLAWGPEQISLYNDGYLPILGAKHPASLGQPAHLLWAEIWETLGPLNARVLAGEPLWFEDMGINLEGRAQPECWFSYSYTPVLDADGRAVGIYCVATETTDKVLSERRLLSEQERQRGALQQMPGFVAITRGPEHVYEYVNDAFVAIAGPREVLGRSFRDVFPDLAGQGFYEAVDHAYATGEPFQARARPIRLAGEDQDRFIDILYQPVRNDVGQVTGIFVGGYDVTDRVRADRALRESEAALREANATLEARVAERTAERNLLADLVEGTDTFVQVADLGFRWLAINKASADEFERIYGMRPKVGDSMLDLLSGHPEHQATVRAVWARALAGEEFTEVGEFGDPGRDQRAYEMKFNTLRDATGQRIGAYQFVYDVTDRVRQQERLREAQEQLRQSQKMEAMGSLTGGVAHDFNNLLTPIIGSLDRLVSRGVGSERERRLMAGALESAERARVLVQRLLAFARRQPLQAVAVDVGALVEGMAGLIGSTLGPAINVRVDLADGLPPAMADPNQVEMALLNLAVNARDAMPGGGTLTVAASRESVRGKPAAALGLRPGHYVRLSVADTGTGMDEATRARAVEPFFSTKGVGRGTGLGLSMVDGLVSQLGGGLAIDSAPGRGTTVALWLPISAEPIAEADGGRAAPQPVALRGRALLVDDEDLVRMSTADMLAEMGFEVLEAGSAEEALGCLREGAAVDLLVTDHLMPGMSGAELAREVRALRPGLPALIVSGYAEVDGIAPGLPRLVKPFRAAELAERVAALVPSVPPAM